MNYKRFFLGITIALALSSCFAPKDTVVNDEDYNFSFTLFDYKSWSMIDYEEVEKTNPDETFNKTYSNMEILVQNFFTNKKTGDKFRYCVVKIPDQIKEATIQEIFSDFQGAEFGAVNGRNWMTRGQPINNGETFRIFGATKTAEYLYSIVYDTSDVEGSSRIARFLREITIKEE